MTIFSVAQHSTSAGNKIVGKTASLSGLCMSASELTALCISIWGVRWKSAAARHLRVSRDSLTDYGNGLTGVPKDVADRIRAAADIGAAGQIIKKALATRLTPAELGGTDEAGTAVRRAHFIAADIVAELTRAGLLRKGN
jgi:hypothetical protein